MQMLLLCSNCGLCYLLELIAFTNCSAKFAQSCQNVVNQAFWLMLLSLFPWSHCFFCFVKYFNVYITLPLDRVSIAVNVSIGLSVCMHAAKSSALVTDELDHSSGN